MVFEPVKIYLLVIFLFFDNGNKSDYFQIFVIAKRLFITDHSVSNFIYSIFIT